MNKILKQNLKKVYDQTIGWDVMRELFDWGIYSKYLNSKLFKTIFYTKLKLRYLIKKKASIPFLSFFVTTNCTLKCKNCCAFVNKYTPQTHYAPMRFADFKKDLDKLLESIDEIYIFQIVGGEPLLCKDLPHMIRYASTKKQIKNIFITTNCTIMPSNMLLDAIKETKCSVEISYYNTPEVKQYYTEIKDILEKNKIRYSAYIETHNAGFRTMQEIYEDKNNKVDYNNCFDSKCNVLCDGKFYLCLASLYVNRNFSLDTKTNDVIDIRNENSLRTKFIEFYSKKEFDICSYCHFDNIKYNVQAGEQDYDRELNQCNNAN